MLESLPSKISITQKRYYFCTRIAFVLKSTLMKQFYPAACSFISILKAPFYFKSLLCGLLCSIVTYSEAQSVSGIITDYNNYWKTSVSSVGVKGLNIGTGIANLPAGNMSFNVSRINPLNIGDGIPDILVTQIADPSGSTDGYSFIDASGTIIGHKKNIAFTSITPVANWTADFYEASSNPLTLAAGYTNTDRPLRLWAADLSDFGITSTNYSAIQKFTITLLETVTLRLLVIIINLLTCLERSLFH